jgi:hypothetical protein
MLLLFAFLVEQRRRRRDGIGEMRVEAGLVRGIEEREQPVVILLRDGIVFVVVATRAFHGQPEKRATERVDAVGIVFDTELFVHAAAFVGLTMQAVERGGDFLVLRGVWQ